MNIKASKILTHVVAFILGAAIGAGIYGAVDNIPKPDVSGGQIAESSDGVVIMGDSSGTGLSLTSTVIPDTEYGDYGISPMSVETAYTVTASFEPEGTTETGIIWSLDWGSKQGVWNGDSKGDVNDFVGLSPAGMKATVTCKKAFGTQIILKAACQNYPDVTASLTIDYIIRPGTMSDIDYSDSKAITLCINDDGGSYTSGYELLPASGNSSGTISGTYTVKSAVFEPVDYHMYAYDEFKKAASNYSWGGLSVYSSISLIGLEPVNEFRGHFRIYYSYFFGGNGPGVGASNATCKSNLKACIVKAAQSKNMGKIKFTVEYAYEDYYSTTLTCSVGVKNFDISALSVAPTAVNLSKSGLLY